MKTLIYARVSTDHQAHASQLDSLRLYCQQRGLTDVEELVDTGSGVDSKRAGLKELQAHVRSGRVQTVVCFKLDRLGRSLQQLVTLLGEMELMRVALIVPSQGIDTSSTNPAAKLQLNILSAVAEFERSIIQERVKAGLAAAKARGVLPGRKPKLPLLYPRIQELLGEGKGVCAIARVLRISKGSVSKIVKDLRSQAQSALIPQP